MALPPACFTKMTPGLGSSLYVVYRCHKQRSAGISMYDGNGKRPVAPDIVFSHGHTAFGNSYSSGSGSLGTILIYVHIGCGCYLTNLEGGFIRSGQQAGEASAPAHQRVSHSHG